MTSWRQAVPPLFVLLLLLLPGLGFVTPWFWWAWGAMIGLYLAVDVRVSAWLAMRKNRMGLLPRLMCVFPRIHVAWASGLFRRLLQRPKPGTFWSY